MKDFLNMHIRVVGSRQWMNMFTYRGTPSPGLCLRPASALFVLVLDLIIGLARPLLYSGVLESSEGAGEIVVLEETLAAEAIS